MLAWAVVVIGVVVVLRLGPLHSRHFKITSMPAFQDLHLFFTELKLASSGARRFASAESRYVVKACC